MSAFCGKYPSCDCVGVGTKCYDRDTVIKNSELPKQKGACDLSAVAEDIAEDTQQEVAEVKKELTEQEQAKQLGISLARFQAAKDYARQLHIADKRMKTSTIRTKVCQKFNIKLT